MKEEIGIGGLQSEVIRWLVKSMLSMDNLEATIGCLQINEYHQFKNLKFAAHDISPTLTHRQKHTDKDTQTKTHRQRHTDKDTHTHTHDAAFKGSVVS